MTVISMEHLEHASILTGIDQVTVLLLQCLPCLFLGTSSLGDYELDVILLYFCAISRGLGLVVGSFQLGSTILLDPHTIPDV
jgi:hypothetical protein